MKMKLEKEWNNKAFIHILAEIPLLLIGFILIGAILVILFLGVVLSWKVIIALMFGIGGLYILIKQNIPMTQNMKVLVSFVLFGLAIFLIFVI